MNIIYHECNKLLDITKRGLDFIGMSVFNQFLIDNIWFVTFVSQIEGCGGLICRPRGLGYPLECQNCQSGHDGDSGGRRCPLLPPLFYLRMKNSLSVPRSDGISLFNPQSNLCNIYFSVVISRNLISPLQFSKITVFSLFSLFSWTMFICLILFYVSTSYK
jgi:hypothetical protein